MLSSLEDSLAVVAKGTEYGPVRSDVGTVGNDQPAETNVIYVNKGRLLDLDVHEELDALFKLLT